MAYEVFKLDTRQSVTISFKGKRIELATRHTYSFLYENLNFINGKFLRIILKCNENLVTKCRTLGNLFHKNIVPTKRGRL